MPASAEANALSTAVDSQGLLSAASNDSPVICTSRDAVLHALGLGFGSAPQDAREMAYAYEQPLLKTVPTLATMLVQGRFLGEYGWDERNTVSLEQKLDLYRPLPASGNLLADQRVADVDVSPAGRSCIVLQSDVRLAADDTAVFSLASTLVSPVQRAFVEPYAGNLVRHRTPGRHADLSCDIATRPDQSLLFELGSEANPLYTDPAAARAAGFPAPLLRGRCVLGIACRAILRTICDYDYTLIKGLEARFSAPAHPGDTVTTDMWQDGNVVSFRCTARSRNAVLIDSGKCRLSG